MELLKVGQKLSISFPKGSNCVEITGVISSIDDDRLSIELPPYFMRYIEFLEEGSPLTAKVFSKMGTVDFNSVVILSPLEDGNFTIELDYNAMRLTPSENIPFVSAIVSMKMSTNNEEYIVKTFEISTEYIKIHSSKKLAIGNNYNCKLYLPSDYGIITFKASVVSNDEVYDNEYTLSFYSMSEYDRQNLLYYMYVYSNSDS